MQSVTWLTILGAFALGIILSLLGSLKLTLARRLNIGETRMGGLVSAFSLALIPLMLISGLLLDALGPRTILIAGSVLVAAALFAMTIREDYRFTLFAVLLLGFGTACLSVSTIVLMPRAFFGQDTHVLASLNLGNVFVALGALIIPTLAEVLLAGLGFVRTLRLLAIVVLVPAVVAPLADLHSDLERANPLEVITHAEFWLAAVVFALYVPVETFLSTWSTTFLTDLGHREYRAAWLLSGFWLMLLAGRIITAYLQIHGVIREAFAPWLVMFLALGVAVALGNLAGATSRQRAAAGLMVLGFLMGPIFPTLVSVVFQHFEKERGTAYGAMFAVGSLAGLVLAPIIGRYVRYRKVQQALRIPMFLALLMTLVALVLALVALNSA